MIKGLHCFAFHTYWDVEGKSWLEDKNYVEKLLAIRASLLNILSFYRGMEILKQNKGC